MAAEKYKATLILWQAAGSPPGLGDTPGLCRICGERHVGLPFPKWVRETFTDWGLLLPGDIICQRCQFSFEEQSWLLAQKVGRDKPQRMRNYSHFVVSGEWSPIGAWEKGRIAELLRTDWDLAIIARSGQKHLIFRAQPKVVQFEEVRVWDVPMALRLLEVVNELLALGFSKAEVESGAYEAKRILRAPEAWKELERELKPHRGSAAFALAIFLAGGKK